MTWLAQTSSWTDSQPLALFKNLLEAALFRNPEPQPSSTWSLILNPPMPYWVTLFSQSCRIISVLILLPVLLIGALDFAGYAVFRTLGLHRRRVRIQRQTSAGSVIPLGRSGSRRKPRVYQNDRHRPTDRSNIPSIVQAPLLSPGTYDAETLLKQRARSMSVASAEEHAAWVASGGQQARISTLAKDGLDPTNSTDGEQSDDAPADYFGRAPRVGVDGALGLPDTDVESGTESGRESPVQSFKSRRRGLSGGLNFTPVSPNKADSISVKSGNSEAVASAVDAENDTGGQHYGDSASVLSLSDSPTSSNNGDRLTQGGNKGGNRSDGEGSGSNMSSSWIGVEADVANLIAPPVTVDAIQAAAAAGLEPTRED